MVRKIFYILFFLFITLYTYQQDDISEKKVQLQDIRDEIKNLENEIKQQTKKEKESYSAVENYNKQGHLLNKLIAKLRDEERKKQKEIAATQNNIIEIEKEIELLKKNYAKYVVAIYKYGKIDELTKVFDSDSFEQAALRIKYLQRFSDKREKDLIAFEESKNELQMLKLKLEKDKKKKALLVIEKEREEASLEEKLSEKKKILKTVKDDKAVLKKELQAKKDAEVQIKKLIARLAEEAERKKEEKRIASINKNEVLVNETPEVHTYDIDLSTADFENFSSLKGKLVWPVVRGKIIRRFGENKNRKLNTITLNYGVDIKVSGDLSVVCVAGGIVSVIDYIPGYGSVIIVTHKGEYRTVYSHLAEIYVSEGDKVKTGSLIAGIGESIEGNILHFEIWNSRSNQNPENWLAKR